jgi:hypothetical protein
MECFCDYDPPEFWNKSDRKARKEHRCYECGRPIKPGEIYEVVAGVWDGQFDTFKTCSHCRDIRQFVKNSVPCFCWAHGNLDEDVRNTIEEAYWRARDEVRGLAFRVGRMVIARKRASA